MSLEHKLYPPSIHPCSPLPQPPHQSHPSSTPRRHFHLRDFSPLRHFAHLVAHATPVAFASLKATPFSPSTHTSGLTHWTICRELPVLHKHCHHSSATSSVPCVLRTSKDDGQSMRYRSLPQATWSHTSTQSTLYKVSVLRVTNYGTPHPYQLQFRQRELYMAFTKYWLTGFYSIHARFYLLLMMQLEMMNASSFSWHGALEKLHCELHSVRSNHLHMYYFIQGDAHNNIGTYAHVFNSGIEVH